MARRMPMAGITAGPATRCLPVEAVQVAGAVAGLRRVPSDLALLARAVQRRPAQERQVLQAVLPLAAQPQARVEVLVRT